MTHSQPKETKTMTPKKLDLTKLTTEHFSKQPEQNCEDWKTYKSTRSKKVKLQKVIRNKFWLWKNLDRKYFSQYTKFLKSHSNKCVNCEEELKKSNSDEMYTRHCDNCSSKFDYCRVCDEESYDDYGVNCRHKHWNSNIASYSGTGASEREEKYYRRGLWELCEAMGGNFANDLLLAVTGLEHDLDFIPFIDYDRREIMICETDYSIPATDALQYGWDWITTLPENFIGSTDKSYEERCKETVQKTVKWVIEYIGLSKDFNYLDTKFAFSYLDNYGDFALIGEDTNYPYYMELLASMNSILKRDNTEYLYHSLEREIPRILKSSRKKILYSITRRSMFEWHLQITKQDGEPILRRIERNKIRCEAQLIHFLKGKKDANQARK